MLPPSASQNQTALTRKAQSVSASRHSINLEAMAKILPKNNNCLSPRQHFQEICTKIAKNVSTEYYAVMAETSRAERLILKKLGF